MERHEAEKLSNRLDRVYPTCGFPWGTKVGVDAAHAALAEFKADEVRKVVDLWVREMTLCPMPGELRGAVLCAQWLDPDHGAWRG